jgi:chromosome segregation ATPase
MEEVQKTLEEILAKLAAVTTEVKATSEEVHGFRKQMEDYGTDLDGVKHRVQEANRQGRPSQLEVPLQKGALTNHGAPLLGSVPTVETREEALEVVARQDEDPLIDTSTMPIPVHRS